MTLWKNKITLDSLTAWIKTSFGHFGVVKQNLLFRRNSNLTITVVRKFVSLSSVCVHNKIYPLINHISHQQHHQSSPTITNRYNWLQLIMIDFWLLSINDYQYKPFWNWKLFWWQEGWTFVVFKLLLQLKTVAWTCHHTPHPGVDFVRSKLMFPRRDLVSSHSPS